MKLVCDHCGAANEVTAVRVDGDRVVITCNRCGRESSVAAEGNAAESGERDERSIDEAGSRAERSKRGGGEAARCPRCFHRQMVADFCHRCGLDLTRDDIDTASWDDIPPEKQEAHARAIELWARLLREPEEAERHEAFVDHCTEERLLTFAVRRYREYLSDHPGSDSMIAFRDQAVRKLETVAMTMLASDRWSQDVARRVRVAKRVLLIVAAVLLIAGLVLLVVVFRQKGTLSPTAF